MIRGGGRRARRIVVVVALLSGGLLATRGGPAGAGDAAPAVKQPRALPGWPLESVPGSLLVTRTDGTVDNVRVAAGDEERAARRLRARADVVAVEPDHLRTLLRSPDDPLFPQQWSHELTHAPAAWGMSTGDRASLVAVIDTGIDGTHPSLAPNVAGQVDVSSGAVIDRGRAVDNDPCGLGHGTFVAGIVGAVGDDATDVVGVAWDVGIVDISVSDPLRCGSFADSAVLAGIAYAASLGVDAINVSLGAPGDTCSTAYQAAIDSARAAGAVVVVAGGNEQRAFPGLTTVPASCNGVIAVGAVGESGVPAGYSSANPWIDLAAPGGDMARGSRGVLSTLRGGGVGTREGTSFAAPYVSGAIALMRTADPELTPDQVEAVLEGTATRRGGRTDALGWGVIDVATAVAVARLGTPPPLPPEPRFPVGLVVRVSSQDPVTEPASQAVAISRFVFPEQRAQLAVLARHDDFADALAGSSLGFGAGPILFTGSDGALDPATAAELERVLPLGAPVYLLGGTRALPASLEDELVAYGFEPHRLAGATRQDTAAAVAAEVSARLAETGFPSPRRMILATAREWPDAVTAGSLGAWFGYPILLTDAGSLSGAARDVLAFFRPEQVYVVGGTTAVAESVAQAAGDAAGAPVTRLAGATRDETAVAVARRFVADFRAVAGVDPTLAVGVNLRRADGFTHVLSASAALGAYSGVYLPVEGEAGDVVPPSVTGFACSISPAKGIVAGNADVVSDESKSRLNALLEHAPSACRPASVRR